MVLEEHEIVGKEKPTLDSVLKSRGSEKFVEVMELHAQIAEKLIKEDHSYLEVAYMMMISHKLARLSCGYGDQHDNLIDIAGYSTLLSEAL